MNILWGILISIFSGSPSMAVGLMHDDLSANSSIETSTKVAEVWENDIARSIWDRQALIALGPLGYHSIFTLLKQKMAGDQAKSCRRSNIKSYTSYECASKQAEAQFSIPSEIFLIANGNKDRLKVIVEKLLWIEKAAENRLEEIKSSLPITNGFLRVLSEESEESEEDRVLVRQNMRSLFTYRELFKERYKLTLAISSFLRACYRKDPQEILEKGQCKDRQEYVLWDTKKNKLTAFMEALKISFPTIAFFEKSDIDEFDLKENLLTIFQRQKEALKNKRDQLQDLLANPSEIASYAASEKNFLGIEAKESYCKKKVPLLHELELTQGASVIEENPQLELANCHISHLPNWCDKYLTIEQISRDVALGLIGGPLLGSAIRGGILGYRGVQAARMAFYFEQAIPVLLADAPAIIGTAKKCQQIQDAAFTSAALASSVDAGVDSINQRSYVQLQDRLDQCWEVMQAEILMSAIGAGVGGVIDSRSLDANFSELFSRVQGNQLDGTIQFSGIPLRSTIAFERFLAPSETNKFRLLIKSLFSDSELRRAIRYSGAILNSELPGTTASLEQIVEHLSFNLDKKSFVTFMEFTIQERKGRLEDIKVVLELLGFKHVGGAVVEDSDLMASRVLRMRASESASQSAAAVEEAVSAASTFLTGPVQGKLSLMLRNLYSDTELRRAVRYSGAILSSKLPGRTASLALIADHISKNLDKKSFVTFMEYVAEDRSGRSRDIDEFLDLAGFERLPNNKIYKHGEVPDPVAESVTEEAAESAAGEAAESAAEEVAESAAGEVAESAAVTQAQILEKPGLINRLKNILGF
ncbi:MAG: hypothetical protein HOE90_17685 [Bacteriovoracaceae bacterium]|nr:hypothetical protein [Bacteriovoracaceae bacterium]